MIEDIEYDELVPGTRYAIFGAPKPNDMGYDPDSPYMGVFKSNVGIESTFKEVTDVRGTNRGEMTFGADYFYYALVNGAPPALYDLVVGKRYIIVSYEDPSSPYRGIFKSKKNGLSTFEDVEDRTKQKLGLKEFDDESHYFHQDSEIVEVSIEVPRSDLEPSDIFTGDEFKQGDRVIKLSREKNNWIFNRDELEKWWKKNPNTNPLVSGDKPFPADTKIEYGTLKITGGGRRRGKTIRMKKSDYLREHHHLFKVLGHPTPRKLARELKTQKKELRERGFKGGRLRKTRRRHK
jgi:hypothetical protein